MIWKEQQERDASPLHPSSDVRGLLFQELEESSPLVQKESESGWTLPFYNTKELLEVSLAQCLVRTTRVCLLIPQ